MNIMKQTTLTNYDPYPQVKDGLGTPCSRNAVLTDHQVPNPTFPKGISKEQIKQKFLECVNYGK